MAADYMNISRQPIPMLPLDRRTGMTEVETRLQRAGSDGGGAALPEVLDQHHSSRATSTDGTDCMLCGGCVDVCPENCLELVSLDRIRFRRRMPSTRFANHPECSASNSKA